MSTLYYSKWHPPRPEDTYQAINGDHPYMLVTGNPTTQPNGLCWEVPVDGAAVVILGRRATILVPVNPPSPSPSDAEGFHNFKRHLRAIVYLITEEMVVYFPTSERVTTTVVCRWSAAAMHNYISEVRGTLKHFVPSKSIQWIDIPPRASATAGIPRVLVRQNNGTPTLCIDEGTSPISIHETEEGVPSIWTGQPENFPRPAVRLPTADRIYEIYTIGNPPPLQGNIDRVVSNIASQVSATTTCARQPIVPSPDYQSEARGVIQSIEFPAGPSNSQSQPGHAWQNKN